MGGISLTFEKIPLAYLMTDNSLTPGIHISINFSQKNVSIQSKLFLIFVTILLYFSNNISN